MTFIKTVMRLINYEPPKWITKTEVENDVLRVYIGVTCWDLDEAAIKSALKSASIARPWIAVAYLYDDAMLLTFEDIDYIVSWGILGESS